ncbi:hypothetical protein GIB67_014800 [Kingdonia uniflora]|uniref:Transposase n=1 Tax=Kingdonia uniflora TaxID=39325 RepID=A0A7J7NV55_9MAGN|nr:hypothetical protein GIB67_014800 [Kingdonia uniflora]
MEVALRNNPNVAVHIGGSNNLAQSPPTGCENITQSQPDSPSEEMQSISKEEENKCKRTRGPIKCQTMAADSRKKIQVGFNERGQDIEEGSVDLSMFLGSLGREMVPITVGDWWGFDKIKLDRIWEIIKQKFVLDEHNKKYCLQSLGKLWRSYKSRLRAKIDTYKLQEEVEAAKPKHFDSMHWKTFAKRKSCMNFTEKSKRFKEMRKKQVLPYTSSRKAYARLENDMKKKSRMPSSVSRVDVWAKEHTKKSGQPSSQEVAKNLVFTN